MASISRHVSLLRVFGRFGRPQPQSLGVPFTQQRKITQTPPEGSLVEPTPRGEEDPGWSNEKYPFTRPLLFRALPDFRDWMRANHETCDYVWIMVRLRSKFWEPALRFPAVRDVCHAFGWCVDYTQRRYINNENAIVLVKRRSPKSVWGKTHARRTVEYLWKRNHMETVGEIAMFKAIIDKRWPVLEGRDFGLECVLLGTCEKHFPEAVENWDQLPETEQNNCKKWIMAGKTCTDRELRILLVGHNLNVGSQSPTIGPGMPKRKLHKLRASSNMYDFSGLPKKTENADNNDSEN